MKNKAKSSFEEFMEDKEQRAPFEEGYKALLLSELILAFKEKDEISVRRLAAAAGVSPIIIQEIGSGETKNMTVCSSAF